MAEVKTEVVIRPEGSQRSLKFSYEDARKIHSELDKIFGPKVSLDKEA